MGRLELKKILFLGHKTSANRGNEAILAGTVELLKSRYGEDLDLYCYSATADDDTRQWLRTDLGQISFISYPRLSNLEKAWKKLTRSPYSRLAGLWPFRLNSRLKKFVSSMDVVISVGGDLYTLDYPPQGQLMAIERFARKVGLPTLLWGASVGPLGEAPILKRRVFKHLSGHTFNFVREYLTYNELADSGVKNLRFAWDPAFMLKAVGNSHLESTQPDLFKGLTLGFNISPLTITACNESERDTVISALAKRLGDVCTANSISNIILIPHVDSELSSAGDDLSILLHLHTALKCLGIRAYLLDAAMNCAELKGVISRCDFLVAGRTHATIAAFSCGVPTISISYSRKSIGINKLLFGDDQWVLSKNELVSPKFNERVQLLLRDRYALKDVLRQKAVLAQIELNESVGAIGEIL